MSSVTRAASIAAVSFCAALLAGTTTPGFAQEFHRAPIAKLNAITQPQVPENIDPAAPVAAPEALVAAPLSPEAVDPVDEIAEIDETEAYASLAAAVAAQTAAADDRELRCLASGVYFESNGEPLAGQLAVAQTILNRAKSGRFPKSICSVLTQPGQFSFVRGGSVPSAEGRRGWNTAVAVAKVASRDLWDAVAPKALFFHARHVSPGWRMARVAAVGNHVFYR